MPHDIQGHPLLLLFLPVAVALAGLVTVFVPPLSETETSDDATAVRQAVYADCQAQAQAHAPGVAASRSGTTPRTQSPVWLQQRQAEFVHCLQARLPGQVLSASR